MLSTTDAVQLAEMVYSSRVLEHSMVVIPSTNLKFNVVDRIDTSAKLTGGLEAIAVQNKTDLVIVVRGADVGVGRDIFRLLHANDNFIPDSKDLHKLRSVFQDWLWNGLFGTIGIVPMGQYTELQKFYDRVKHQDVNMIVVGHSLGGELAQKLALEYDIHAVTFSALSPWWILNHNQRKSLRDGTFLDTKIENYYSRSDPFRYFPLLTRHVGVQNEVVLKNYTSNSSMLAMALERIYWAHGTDFYESNKHGDIKTMNTIGTVERVLKKLNEKTTKTLWVDVVILLSGIVPTVLSWIIFQIIFQKFVPDYDLTGLSIVAVIMLSIIAICSVVVYMLPTLIIHSRWKYVVWGLNLVISWTGLGWLLLLLLSAVLNSIAVYGKNNTMN